MFQPLNIAFLGIGLMGQPMARHLLKAGHHVNLWNRSVEKAQILAKDGGKIFDTPAEAARGCTIVITMLSDGKAVRDVIIDQGVADSLSEHSVLIDMSSTKPIDAKSLAKELETKHIAFLDAPVSGGVKGAEQASLAIMVGGDEAIFNKVKPVLELMGRPVRVGNVGAGQMSKLANQSIVAITISAVAEAMLLAEKAGVDRAALRAALKGGFADSLILQQHGKRMSEENYTPGGRSILQLKDLNNVLEEARALELTLPLVETTRDRFDYLCHEMGEGESDHSALMLELKQRNHK